MKKLFLALFVLGFMSFNLQTAQASYESWGFAIYNGTREPVDYAIPGATIGKKTGEATCRTVAGIVNWGDCTIKTAMKNGKIQKVTAADWEKKFIILYGKKTLRVYGN